MTAPLVFVNYGVPEDYEKLDRLGISVKGAIVIAQVRWILARHQAEGGGRARRGRLPDLFRTAETMDTRDGDVFPQGRCATRMECSAVASMDMPHLSRRSAHSRHRGDAGCEAAVASKRRRRITKIPVLPISYGDAQPLLAALKGPMAPAAWRGACRSRITSGPGPAKVHLKLEFNWDLKPLYNVIAKIPGSTDPDEWIIRGNHHDAWVNGAEDPVSGRAPLARRGARAGSCSSRDGSRSAPSFMRVGWRRAEAARVNRVG